MNRRFEDSWFVSRRPRFSPRRTGSAADRLNFEGQSWLKRLVPVRPGHFVLPAPTGAEAYDPLPPARQLHGEPIDPRHYLGRLHEVVDGILVLTLWEVPSGRELFASVEPGREVTTSGRLRPGAPVDVWTWSEINGGASRERVHLAGSGRRPLRR